MEITEIPVLEFIEQRAGEMKVMLEKSKEVGGNNAPQQRLPRHMRRRAANHDIKRVPWRLRTQALKDSLAVQKKRPSRKHRRRPSNLLKEYQKRSSKKRWLETHIWHAKRFHMAELWNCKIALRRCDRGERAAYRDSRKECLLIDLSWLNCFEFIGTESDIMASLEPFISNKQEGSSIVSRFYLGGRREGETVFYKRNGIHWIPIANAKFLWRCDVVERARRSLWIWVHPSSSNELLEHFRQTLSLVCSENNDGLFTNGTIDLVVRTKDYCRYRLIGPKSQSVLATALKLADLESKEFKEVYNYGAKEMSSVRDQQRYWSDLGTTDPVMLPSRSVCGLMVKDPRMNMPTGRLNSELTGMFSSSAHHELHRSEHSLSYSCIWDEVLMKKLQQLKLSTHNMNELRSGSLLSGYNPSIPILLLQNPGSTNGVGGKGHGGGWDVVVPSGWGMAFWLGFVYRGARTIGLKELSHLDYESGVMTFPDFYPDSDSGKEEQLSKYQQLLAKYLRLPPAKRPNYGKLKASTPFHCPWQELSEEWNLNCEASSEMEGSIAVQKFYVVRDNKFLKELDRKMHLRPTEISEKKTDARVTRKVVVKGSSRSYLTVEKNGVKKVVLDKSEASLDSSYYNKMFGRYSFGLVPVAIEMLGKGSLKKFSMISIPLESDVQVFLEGGRIVSETNGSGMQKKIKYDTSSIQRVTNVVNFCSRQTVGFAMAGGFSFSHSKGMVVGFVALPGIDKLIKSNEGILKSMDKTASKKATSNLVLVRSTMSLNYRFGIIRVILDNPQ